MIAAGETAFEVWAPNARRVEIVTEAGRSPLQPASGGWFTGARPTGDYSLSIDGGDPRPDPRSHHQPHGVHGPSRIVDHDGSNWTATAWTGFELGDAVIYELHVGTFTPEGTFDAVISKLGHLAGLGINAIELMPVNAFPGHHGWGYDGVGLYAPHEPYGGPGGLKRLVDACHARGIAVILDVVYNHLGPAGNYLREFGPYFTDRYSTPWGEAVNLDDRGSPNVRAFFIDDALHWFRNYRVDGLRLDAIHALFDQSAIGFLEEMSRRVTELGAELGRPLWLIAESDLNDPRVVTPRDRGGYGIDAQWSDDLHHALHAVFTGETQGYYSDFGSVGDIAKALRDAFVYDGRYSAFRDRVHGRPASGLSGHRFLAYLQTHDQVGNRALGDRTSALMTHDRLKVGAALVLTSPFVPMLFMGEEWGASSPFLYFTDHDDAELGRAVAEGRRREFAAFGWDPATIPDPQDPATLERSKLDWTELDDQPHADLLEWHRRLIALRRDVPGLRDGRMDLVRTTHDDAEGWLVAERPGVLVVANLSPHERRIPLERAPGSVALASGKQPRPEGAGVIAEAWSIAVYLDG